MLHHLAFKCWLVLAGFEMSDAQKVHASTAEHLVPSLEALRHKICSFLSEKNFWMIYFVLLLPGLQEHDAKILSTPKAKLPLHAIDSC